MDEIEEMENKGEGGHGDHLDQRKGIDGPEHRRSIMLLDREDGADGAVGNINDCTDFDAFQTRDLKAQCAVSAVTDEITKRSTSNKNTSKLPWRGRRLRHDVRQGAGGTITGIIVFLVVAFIAYQMLA